MEKNKHLEFRFGLVGKLIPLLTAVAIIFLAAMNQSNVNGYVVAFFMAIIGSSPSSRRSLASSSLLRLHWCRW